MPSSTYALVLISALAKCCSDSWPATKCSRNEFAVILRNHPSSKQHTHRSRKSFQALLVSLCVSLILHHASKGRFHSRQPHPPTIRFPVKDQTPRQSRSKPLSGSHVRNAELLVFRRCHNWWMCTSRGGAQGVYGCTQSTTETEELDQLSSLTVMAIDIGAKEEEGEHWLKLHFVTCTTSFNVRATISMRHKYIVGSLETKIKYNRRDFSLKVYHSFASSPRLNGAGP